MMIVTSSAIKNGYFDDKYGKKGSAAFFSF